MLRRSLTARSRQCKRSHQRGHVRTAPRATSARGLGSGMKYNASAPTSNSVAPQCKSRGQKAPSYNRPRDGALWPGGGPVPAWSSYAGATVCGADSATASVSGTCTEDKADGRERPGSGFGLKYPDETAPQVTAGEAPPARPPPSSIQRPRSSFDFGGVDATSGVTACPRPSRTRPPTGALPP